MSPSASDLDRDDPGLPLHADVVVVGGGAAGLATAVFIRRRSQLRVICLDGARRIGAKILVSGGARCNVTNRVVTERDFWGGPSRVVRHVLRAFSAAQAASFFEEIGVALHEEEDGKLFPDTNRSRTVLDALLREFRRLGAELHLEQRVVCLDRDMGGFVLQTMEGRMYYASAVVIATGGRSLPKTGSDGLGYALTRHLGHRLVPTTPALVPLVLNGAWFAALSGISHRVAITITAAGRPSTRLEGPLLWTHFGVSGPVVLNASRHWCRARLECGDVQTFLNVCPGETPESIDAWLRESRALRPRAEVASILGTRLPAAVAQVWMRLAGLDEGLALSHLSREDRRRLARLLVESPLDVRDSRGYGFAEVTAGGVPLTEIDAATMESRACPGLYLVGEILDVDGRLGGFNFQWAWSSAWVAARGVVRRFSQTGALAPANL